MGRSGGGGSSHSSGGFGGGHSSGGFSGGGRSSGRSSGGFSSGGSSHHHNHYYHNSYYSYGPGYGYGYGPRSSLVELVSIIIAIFVILFIMSFLRGNTFNSTVSKTTKQRQPLNGIVNKTDWYEDKIGWISDGRTLTIGLEEFYKATGVQPYVVFIPYSSEYWNNGNINATVADNYLERIYKQKFTDEGHFIFAYFSCQNDSKSEMDGEFRYLSGYSADTIMDNEAIDIFWGYFEENYYNTTLSTEKMISNTFNQTAKNIMGRPTNAWDALKVIVIIAGIIIILVVIYKMFKKKAQRDKEKEEYTKEILSKPLETFGKDTSDLEDKYK